MTIGDRIQDVVGTIASTVKLQQLVDEGVRVAFAELPKEVFTDMYVEEADSGSGVSVLNKILIRAHKAGYKAVMREPDLRTRVTEETNTFEAFQYDPAYYKLGNTVYVKPGGGSVITVTIPTILYSDEDTDHTAVPKLIFDYVVWRTILLALDYQLAQERDGMVTAITLPSAPAAVSAPSISYTDAASVAPAAISIATLPSAPTYNAPSLEAKPSVPTSGTLDLTKKVDGVAALTAPTAPSAPSIDESTASATGVNATSIGALPTPPTYTAPTFGGDLDIPALPALDLTKEIDGVTVLDPPPAPAAPSFTTPAISDVSLSLPSAPTYTKVSEAISKTEWETYRGEEDEGMMAALLAEVQQDVDQLRITIQQELNETNIELATFRSELEKNVALARIQLEERSAEMGAVLRQENEEYLASVQRYSAQLQTYNAEASRVIRKWELDFQKAYEPWARQQQMYLQRMSEDIRSESEAYKGAVQDHMREIDKVIQQAQLDQQRLITVAAQADEVETRNKANDLQAQIQDWEATATLFRLESELYGREAALVVEQFTQDLDRQIQIMSAEGRLDVERFGVLVQNAQASFTQSMAVYQATLNRNDLAANIARQEAQQTAEQATSVDIANKARDLEATVSQYQATLGKHGEDVKSYAQQVDATISEKRAEIEMVAQKLRMMHFDRERVVEELVSVKRAVVRLMWPSHSYTVQHPVI